MRKDRKSPRTGPPYNPRVRELVAAKRCASPPLERQAAVRGFRGWHERGYLPHRDEPGLTQFITFHLADSFPAALRCEWATLLAVEDDRERRKQLEGYLDRGRGECYLRQAEIARIVDEAFQFYHGKRYEIHAWVVMPNHIHVLFKVLAMPLSRIVADLKEFTARQANQILHRSGQF